MEPNENQPGPEELYVFDPQLSTTIENSYELNFIPWEEGKLIQCGGVLIKGCHHRYAAKMAQLEYMADNKFTLRCPQCGRMNKMFDKRELGLDDEDYREMKRLAKKNRRRSRPHLYQWLNDSAVDFLMEHSLGMNLAAIMLLCLILSLIASIILQYALLGYTTFW